MADNIVLENQIIDIKEEFQNFKDPSLILFLRNYYNFLFENDYKFFFNKEIRDSFI